MKKQLTNRLNGVEKADGFFYDLVRQMREKQRMYFRYRRQPDLNASKELEKKVDEAIQLYLEKNLFNNNNL